ncbi:MAG: hypothetical protein KatS3mg129_3101 [Leptospiraceae bacterium]|nr:MAG: hypothetical protein KatS3mg129_3101 [Leptospiraceae bacterium]
MLTTSHIEEGILKVGIGKYGSEPIPDELADFIIRDLENPEIFSIQKGALIGALFLKGFESEGEKKIQKYLNLYTAEDIINQFCSFTKENYSTIVHLLKKLLEQKTLTLEESYQIGKFLFDNNVPENNEFEIGLITTIFRFRYETIEEYLGLLKSIEERYDKKWTSLPDNLQNKTVIITEPFDGVERSYLVTPLIGKTFIENNFIPVYIVSDNPGPKFHYNLKDLAIKLNGTFINSTEEFLENINKNLEPFGFFIDIKELNPILLRWIHRRKLLKKRPFLATLERIYNPLNASIQVFSAFHPPYLEKTSEILQKKNIPVIFGIRRGEEGGLTFSYNKRNESLLSIKQNNNYIQKKDTYFYATTYKISYTPNIEDNKKIIENFSTYKNIYNIELAIMKELENQIQEFQHYINFQIEKTLEIYTNFISEIKSQS